MPERSFLIVILRLCLVLLASALLIKGGLSWAGLLGGDSESQVFADQISLCLGFVSWYGWEVRRRQGYLGLMDLGGLYATAVALYSVIPLLGFLLLGENADLLDNRLLVLNPELSEVADFAWRYPFFLAVFTFFYARFRDYGQEPMEIAKPSPDKIVMVTVLWALCNLYQLGLSYVFGVQGETSYENITEVYQQLQSLPSLVQQITNVVNGLLLMSRLYLLTCLFAHFRNPAARLLLLGWLSGEFVVNVVTFASRTPLFLLMLSSLALFTKSVRRLSMVTLLVLGTLGFAGFMVWGLLRAPVSSKETASVDSDEFVLLGALRSRNEFQAMFTTSFDIYSMRQEGLSVPWSLHVADLLRVFPQQIAPFKVEPADWYLDQKGLAGSGQGYGYGLISESVVGWGYPHLFVLGLALAYVFSRIHRAYLGRSREPLTIAVYLWFCIRCYTFFRVSSFSFLGYAFYGVLPFVLFMRSLEDER